MNLITSNHSFGKVTFISGMELSIEVDSKYLSSNLVQKFIESEEQHTFYIGTIGDIFAIGGPSLFDSMHFAIFEEVRLVSESEKNLSTKAIITAKVIGYQNPVINEKLSFKRGIGKYPKFNSHCFLLSAEEKQSLFSLDSQGLLIGTATGDNNDEIYINVNKFLSKHSIILGSTGSGKSYTVASILQKVIKKTHYSHIVFFDLHNEYEGAFDYKNEEQSVVNKVDSNSHYFPYWMLNFEEFLYIFLGDMDSSKNSEEFRVLKEKIIELKLIEHSTIETEVGKTKKININTPMYFSFSSLIECLEKLNKQTIWKSDGVEAIDEETGNYLNNSGSTKIDRKGKDKDQVLQGSSFNKLTQIIDKLKNILLDKRYNFLFPKEMNNSLDLKDYIEDLLSIKTNTKLTIIDFSKIPSEVTPTIIGLIARLCFEYKLWEENPQNLPIYLVFEEAHNYMPKETSAATKLPKKYISRIAKEGRKYGISQLIISQRPSDLSATIVSQCSNFFILRVTNPDDQSFIQHVLPDHLNTLSSMIPFFENGEILIAGECVTIPTKAIISMPNPIPNSNDINFLDSWSTELSDYETLNTIKKWWDIENE